MLLATTIFAAAPAAAQDAAVPEAQNDDFHEQEPQDIIVTADYVRDLSILAGTQTLSGDELVRDLRPQIGDTLTRLPGVSATSFTAGASRPVLRGFQGERVRVLTDGIGSIDVSNTSADHAVTIDPLTAERIEVLHGPAVLLFGSQAIGGAVNVLDKRIPRRVPDEILHTDIIATYGSAANERSVGGAVDTPLGGGFVLHFDGSHRKTGDVEVGGYVLSQALRAEQLDIAAEEEAEGHVGEAEEARELASLKGRVPNSATETTTYAGGLSFIRDGGNIGFSVSRYESDYGVPARPGAEHAHGEEEPEEEHGHGEEDVTIGLRQTRADLRAEVETGGFIEKLRSRIGFADYSHTEFEGGEVGTVFRTQGLEGRLEAVQADRGGWRGVTGVQFFNRDFAAIGAEAFVPENLTSHIGLFTLQEITLGRWGLEGALRYEHSDIVSRPAGFDRDFTSFSAAAGLSYDIAPQMVAGMSLSRAERSPSAEELLSNGPHIATQAFEVGNPDLKTEKSWGGELYLRGQSRGYRFGVSVFGNRFDDYIFEAATGDEEDGLPVFAYDQKDATYYGVEGELSAPVAEMGGFRFVADVVGDYVRATIKDGGNVPRIPPLRLLGGIEAQSEKIDGRVEVEWTADQAKVAAYETMTEGFTMVNASLAWRPWGRDRNVSLVLSASNIFDVEARRHASFTKDYVPLAGRDLRASVRLSF
ncbi:TonB-dependent receptor [Allosphingosinicella flava]|uniref:TonB-dependent receptor n=1 Tax=Allosphingosinicella flava TaxID=2771430 RepID=A0A7T2LN32_9SPHN|nr:TonB-dependent receptor [Sphingosinicella flava]